jgi:hypothetical protein
VEIRDNLRNARKKKDGKIDQVMPAAKTTTVAPRCVLSHCRCILLSVLL